jgi:hypothetical protein
MECARSRLEAMMWHGDYQKARTQYPMPVLIPRERLFKKKETD